MKVLFCVPNRKFFSKYGGIGGHITHFWGVVEGFIDNDIEVTTITSDDISSHFPSNPEVAKFDLEVLTFGSDRFFSHLRLFLDVLFQSSKFDYVYVRYSASFIFYLIFLGIFLKKKLVIEVNSFGSQYYNFFKLFDRILVGRSNRFIVVSEINKAHAESISGRVLENVLVIENGISTTRIENIYEDQQRDQLCYVGIFKKGYGIEALVKSVVKLNVAGRTVRLNLFGDGGIKDDLASLANGHDCVVFHGAQNYFDIIKYIKKTQPIMVYPSANRYNFQSPIKLFEYLGTGLPIIAQNTSNVAVIQDKVGVFELADLSDANDLNRAIGEINKSTALASNSLRSINFVTENASWKQVIYKTIANL